MITNNLDTNEINNPLFNLIHNLICKCEHHKDEHLNNECYGLDYNGTIWKACNCRLYKALGLNITLYSNLNLNLNLNKDEDNIQ